MKASLTPVFYLLAFLLSSTLLTSCEVIGGIFSAGVYTGIFIVVAVIIIIIVILGRAGKK